MKTFLKGIIVGIGGVSPGLSGSVLLIIFGIYQKTLDALGSFFRNIKENTRFLLPLVSGMFVGVLLFGKIVNFFLKSFEMQTCFCFLGLTLGTIPMIWREVKKEGFTPQYYLYILLSAVAGFWFLRFNPDLFPQISRPNLLQSVVLGIAVAATAIIPSVEPAVLLSTLGLYRAYVAALAEFDLTVLAPMVIGLTIGAVVISFGMSALFRRFYTATYSVIFGVFLPMIPSILTENCVLGFNGASAVSVALLAAGFGVSYVLAKREVT